jgi:hypothetical protein
MCTRTLCNLDIRQHLPRGSKQAGFRAKLWNLVLHGLGLCGAGIRRGDVKLGRPPRTMACPTAKSLEDYFAPNWMSGNRPLAQPDVEQP